MVRPKSARAHTDVLDAAMHLFAERGIDGTSMDAIADASGVSKATIYKHWPDKEALSMEVLLRAHGRDAAPPEFDSGDLRADLLAALSHEPPPQYAPLRERLMPHMLAYSAKNPSFGSAWRARVLEPPRLQLLHVLERGIARGQLPRTLNMDLAIALLFGPILYGHILKVISRQPAPPRLHDLVVDAFLKSFSRTSRHSARRLVSGSTRVARRAGT
jgi:AcrR family transcriptional regulator